MDYEEKYKEALELARDYYKANLKLNKADENLILEDIFSELRESEDERIRKELIDAINGLWDNDALPMPLSVKRKDAWIAWLEEQKEYESTDFEYVWDRTDCGDLTSALDKYSEEAIINMCHAWYDKGIELERKSWLKKQGYTKKDVDDAYLKGICNTKHELEKQDEQESADKHEPKFHEGDFIISNDKKSTYQVIEVKRGIYVIRDNADNHEYHIGIEECEKSGRLFTIQDIKDGDILSNGQMIVIFKHFEEPAYRQHIVAYVGLDINGNIQITDDTWNFGIDKAKPATKEQRNTLFSKMKEAGYEWDDEKKELKKISQRMVSAEAKEALYDKPTDEEMKELLRTEYEKGRADTIAEMESSWSEEDEKVIAIINNALTESNTPPDDYDKVYDWLESIKQRIGG